MKTRTVYVVYAKDKAKQNRHFRFLPHEFHLIKSLLKHGFMVEDVILTQCDKQEMKTYFDIDI